MATHTDNDAAFYDMIHDLLQQQTSDKDQERRDGPRHDYRHVQLIAPYDGETLPTQAEFRLMPCQDISTNGLSFLVSERPGHSCFVVALGNVPFTFVEAEVKNVRDVEEDGQQCFRVGCRFVRRIE